MLFFRSEEHIDRWCTTWRLGKGAVIPLEKGWELARAWYTEDRREPSWRRRTLEETEAVFDSLGFTEEFWNLR
jgi:Alkylmercury lyase